MHVQLSHRAVNEVSQSTKSFALLANRYFTVSSFETERRELNQGATFPWMGKCVSCERRVRERRCACAVAGASAAATHRTPPPAGFLV